MRQNGNMRSIATGKPSVDEALEERSLLKHCNDFIACPHVFILLPSNTWGLDQRVIREESEGHAGSLEGSLASSQPDEGFGPRRTWEYPSPSPSMHIKFSSFPKVKPMSPGAWVLEHRRLRQHNWIPWAGCARLSLQ
ncbi:hypothetical protein PMAYCL1PPCAC_00712 [Pristionchus mayeri]|uniref:Uncharacterized protein n=1 Tax=Pristionchus mayeri TaxID=1317129 RepID=A0AAN4YWY5_9BILA|nr:hypothetical protein PMAYCL1PPCAC_00712 [Pristionchus mayeri]